MTWQIWAAMNSYESSAAEDVEKRLQAAEAELCDMLRRLLPKTAVSGNMLFLNSRYFPTRYNLTGCPKNLKL